MNIFWGFALIWVGLAYMGSSFGWWDFARASEIWMYWPLILIFGGLSALLKGRKYAWAVLVALLLVTTYFIYDISYSDNPLLVRNQSWFRYESGNEYREEEFKVEHVEGSEEILYKINLGATEANISGSTSEALVGKYSSNYAELKRTSALNGDIQQVEVSNENINRPMMWIGHRIKNKVDLSLAKDKPIAIEARVGAASADFDLSEYILNRFLISGGATDLSLRLGSLVNEQTDVVVSAGASSIEIEVPKTVGVSIEMDAGATATNFPGFTKTSDKHYQNSAFSTAAKKIYIVFKTGASSVEVREY